MLLSNLVVRLQGRSLAIVIEAPFWGAWKQYGWDNKQAGIGLNEEVIKTAESWKKSILVQVKRYGTYTISAKKAKAYIQEHPDEVYATRNSGIKLHVLPISVFTRKKVQEVRNDCPAY
jgi:hypothetical protein